MTTPGLLITRRIDTDSVRGREKTMNKDALLATIIGLALGLAIAGVFIFGPTIVRSLPKITIPAISLPKKSGPSPTPLASNPDSAKNFILTINAPLPDAVEPKQDVVVSGFTGSGATVVIQGIVYEDVVIAEPDGAYAGRVTAIEGKNDITVTAYPPGGKNQAQRSVTIYYTEEKL